MRISGVALVIALLFAMPALARDSIGMFGTWGAFREPNGPLHGPYCYAIAKAEPSLKAKDFEPYADVATWPRKQVRGQIHFRLSRRIADDAKILLSLGDQRFELVGGGADAWAADRRMDAAISAGMRSAQSMTVSSRDTRRRYFSNTYPLAGAATAMDAAAIGCSQLR